MEVKKITKAMAMDFSMNKIQTELGRLSHYLQDRGLSKEEASLIISNAMNLGCAWDKKHEEEKLNK